MVTVGAIEAGCRPEDRFDIVPADRENVGSRRPYSATAELTRTLRMYAICRIANKRKNKPKFWCWAVLFRRHNQQFSKSFFDIKCGGSAKAKAAAIA